MIVRLFIVALPAISVLLVHPASACIGGSSGCCGTPSCGSPCGGSVASSIGYAAAPSYGAASGYGASYSAPSLYSSGGLLSAPSFGGAGYAAAVPAVASIPAVVPESQPYYPPVQQQQQPAIYDQPQIIPQSPAYQPQQLPQQLPQQPPQQFIVEQQPQLIQSYAASPAPAPVAAPLQQQIAISPPLPSSSLAPAPYSPSPVPEEHAHVVSPATNYQEQPAPAVIGEEVQVVVEQRLPGYVGGATAAASAAGEPVVEVVEDDNAPSPVAREEDDGEKKAEAVQYDVENEETAPAESALPSLAGGTLSIDYKDAVTEKKRVASADEEKQQPLEQTVAPANNDVYGDEPAAGGTNADFPDAQPVAEDENAAKKLTEADLLEQLRRARVLLARKTRLMAA